MSCEGNSTEWRVMRFSKPDYLYPCSSWGTMTGSTCTITRSWLSGVFWCESETGQFSNAVNITKDDDGDIILVSPVRPVAEGLPVTLSCKLKTQTNNKLIQNDTRSELTISAVSKSDEGFYKCKQRDSANASGPGKDSEFPVLLIVGLLCGVSLIILLLLFLYLYRKSKDSCYSRLVQHSIFFYYEHDSSNMFLHKSTSFTTCVLPTRSQRTNQSPATDHMINQDETNQRENASVLQGQPESLIRFEFIVNVINRIMLVSMKQSKAPKNLQMVQYNESMDVTYSVLELKNISKKGKSSPAPADETVYSELKPGTALGKMQRNIISNNVFCKDKTNGNNIPKLNLCLLNLICSFALHSSDKRPEPVLTVSPSWPSPGASVTLNCRVDHPSAGWSFYWYKAVPQNSDNSYSYELLPGSENETEQDLFIIDGQTHTAGYVCRAAREDPVYYSSYSKPAFVWSGDLNSAASLTVSPDSVQHFTKTSVSLSCEGNSTEWRVRSFWKPHNLYPCSSLETMTGSTYTITSSWFSGVFWCESETGQFSNAVNITIDEIILVSPVRPVAEGSSVTLSCKLNNEAVLYNVDFYKNGKLIQNDTRRELTISAVSKSDEGFYKCKQRDLADGRTSSESWFSVKDSVFIRSQSTNQGPATDHMINQDEIQNMPEYSTLLHGASNEPEESLYINVAEVPDSSSYAAVSIFLFTQSRRISQKQRGRLSVLDVKMGHTLLCPLGLFLLNLLYRGQAQDTPEPVLTVSPSWPSPGASVTLNCRVDHPSAGWSFYWYKAVPQNSDNSYSYELLPGSENGTEEDLFIIDGQTHTAGYVCRAGRGDPVFYSWHSEPKFVWSGDINSAASLTVSPDSVQHFTKTSLSLSCEGNSTEWRVMRFSKPDYLYPCSIWGTMAGSTCRITRYLLSGVYWCESETGQFSNAVNITKGDDIILVSPVRPVAEGLPVTLSCKLKTQTVYNVDFYKNDKLIQNDTRRELTISAVSKSDEGFYKCKQRDSADGRTSPESWFSVKCEYDKNSFSSWKSLYISRPVDCWAALWSFTDNSPSAVPVSLQKIKRSQSTNQGPATDHMINQDEIKNMPEYSTLLHGDRCLYETIGGPVEAGNVVPDFSSYAAVSIFLITQSRRISHKQKSRLSVLDVKMGHTLLSLLGVFLLNLLYRGQAQDTPKPVLTVSPSFPSPGASVTLNCRVDHPSAGWSFYWYKAVPQMSGNSYSYELLHGSENGTEQDLFIIDGQTHTAGYYCRAGRGDPVFYSWHSEPTFIWSGDLNSAASLTVSPDSVQHFPKTSVSLSCEGNSTEWRVRRFSKPHKLYPVLPGGQ
ncbi:hypothetical protein F7725_004707 [Dissostichus mawsoni]|uniref:Ig-like domain-containing protein n=1 Tax=Dissostichus mawsoni TaxID=36200 RepID=A0A7J5XK81_DISMA|nr:hypothetical protein F7725_004707 [Dissostichus mawsoni]